VSRRRRHRSSMGGRCVTGYESPGMTAADGPLMFHRRRLTEAAELFHGASHDADVVGRFVDGTRKNMSLALVCGLVRRASCCMRRSGSVRAEKGSADVDRGREALWPCLDTPAM
jgi:hypothetical protein